jgi:hypothetical protein
MFVPEQHRLAGLCRDDSWQHVPAGGVFKRMAVFQDGSDGAGAGAENGRIGVMEVGIETCLKGLRR